MLRIVLCPDSFKNCLSAPEVCAALRAGLLAANRDLDIVCAPLSDGGEGAAACFSASTGATLISTQVTNAYFQKTEAHFAWHSKIKTAFVEMAQASGIQGIDKNHLHTMQATTLGTGELIAAAIKQGARHIIVGLGGSATTDGGMGALSALGVQFQDAQGTVFSPVGANMKKVRSIVPPAAFAKAQCPSFTYACDVDAPFCGPGGAAQVFAPQKGATEAEVLVLDAGLKNLAVQYASAFGTDVTHMPGAGAAGGLCGGLVAAFGGCVQSGFEILAQHSGLENVIRNADLVVTGEGRTDLQSALGKLPARVCALTKQYQVPCVLISGDITADFHPQQHGFLDAIALKTPAITKDESIQRAAVLLQAAAQKIWERKAEWIVKN